ncbi:MAG TPA: FAD-dependent oxidoreductase, partial [Thermoanaerobaculia bacterium]|nr:FAD-dependent oxidoreductase [Thermoanaerobaculia bacterium]
MLALEDLVQPLDEHNRRLVSHVHPEDWQNPQPRSRYDLVVIGGGTAGLVSAAGAAGLGARVALVERHLLGGDCLNTGCVPSKALIAASRAWHVVRNGEEMGAAPPIGTGDFTRVMERMRRLRADIAEHDGAARFQQLGVDVFLGNARFTGSDVIEVDGSRLAFKRAVIATGARAAVPPIAGLADAGYLTNETVFNLTARPRRLLVVGGGPLGCELAQAFCRLGCAVTIASHEPYFLPGEERDAADILAHALRRDGIDVRLNTDVKSVVCEGGEKRARLVNYDQDVTVAVDEILAGAGRVPHVEGLNLEAAGVDYDPRQGVR